MSERVMVGRESGRVEAGKSVFAAARRLVSLEMEQEASRSKTPCRHPILVGSTGQRVGTLILSASAGALRVDVEQISWSVSLWTSGEGSVDSTQIGSSYASLEAALEAAKNAAGDGAESCADGHGEHRRIGYRGAAGTAWIS